MRAGGPSILQALWLQAKLGLTREPILEYRAGPKAHEPTYKATYKAIHATEFPGAIHRPVSIPYCDTNTRRSRLFPMSKSCVEGGGRREAQRSRSVGRPLSRPTAPERSVLSQGCLRRFGKGAGRCAPTSVARTPSRTTRGRGFSSSSASAWRRGRRGQWREVMRCRVRE